MESLKEKLGGTGEVKWGVSTISIIKRSDGESLPLQETEGEKQTGGWKGFIAYLVKNYVRK